MTAMSREMTRPSRWLLWTVLVLLVIAILFAIPLWSYWRDRQAVRELRPEDRRVLYDHTLQSFRLLCVRHGEPRFSRYCEQQAEFLVLFPECDRECLDLIAASRPAATK